MADEATVHNINALPEELVQCILECLDSPSIAAAARVCHRWHAMAPAAARGSLRRRGCAEASPCCLRTLHALEALEAHIGPPPSARTWRAEWKEIDREQSLLNFEEALCDEFYAAGAPCSIEMRLELPQFAETVAWQLAAGWSHEDAVAYTLLFNYGRGALRCALEDRSPRYAAATHALCRALARAALRASASPTAVPPAYVNLHGAWGLATVDPVWHALEKPTAAVGLRLCVRAVGGAERADKAFPNDRGMHVPITYSDGVTAWELVHGPVVRIISRPADVDGMHALVPSAPSAFDLPPLATVTLERVEMPGAWRANGLLIQQRCYTVSVTFG